MSFEKQVKIALVKKEWSQRDLAKEMGITISYLSDILKGNRNPQDRIEQIKDLLKDEWKEE